MFNAIFIQDGVNSIQVSSDNVSWQNIEKNTITDVTTLPVYNVGKLQSTRQDRLNYFIVRIRMNSGSYQDFDIQDVRNQPLWTPNAAGLNLAAATIQGWIN